MRSSATLAHCVTSLLRTMTWVVALLALMVAPALAWGPEGHQVVGSIADQLLNHNAKQQVATILGTKLRAASTWADCARSVEQ